MGEISMAIDVKIVQKETIRPASPTPLDLTTLRLSLSDQFTPDIYISLIFFYPVVVDSIRDTQVEEKSLRLKTSLSDTLNQFYPLAGRIKDNSTVECLDQGAQYIEARINCPLSGILEKPDEMVLKQLLPAAIESNEVATGYLLLVQATFFGCGGLALGICVTHKIADAATFNLFINSWAATARNSSAQFPSPLFVGASLFPPIDFSPPKTSLEMAQQFKCVTKRFVFDGSKIESLQAKISSVANKKPTRVESVLVLVWKCAAKASRSQKGAIRQTVCSLSVNLRKRLEPPLPENYAGNMVGLARASAIKDEELNLDNLFGLIRKDIEEVGEKNVRRIKEVGAVSAICQFAKDFGELAMDSEIDYYNCTSWCRFELYEADFGWGKPMWLASSSTSFKNVAILMDTRNGDGIEVWLTLTEEDMALFESNEELLEFAAVNPRVI